MAVALKINVRAEEAINGVRGIHMKLPGNLGKAGFVFAKRVQRNMRAELTMQGLIWSRRLWRGIQARRLSKYMSVVAVPIHGIRLDSMDPHFVKLKRGRLIRRWALQKGNENVRRVAMREGSIFVRPHPWIDRPIAVSYRALPSIVKKYADEAVVS